MKKHDIYHDGFSFICSECSDVFTDEEILEMVKEYMLNKGIIKMGKCDRK